MSVQELISEFKRIKSNHEVLVKQAAVQCGGCGSNTNGRWCFKCKGAPSASEEKVAEASVLQLVEHAILTANSLDEMLLKLAEEDEDEEESEDTSEDTSDDSDDDDSDSDDSDDDDSDSDDSDDDDDDSDDDDNDDSDDDTTEASHKQLALFKASNLLDDAVSHITSYIEREGRETFVGRMFTIDTNPLVVLANWCDDNGLVKAASQIDFVLQVFASGCPNCTSGDLTEGYCKDCGFEKSANLWEKCESCGAQLVESDNCASCGWDKSTRDDAKSYEPRGNPYNTEDRTRPLDDGDDS